MHACMMYTQAFFLRTDVNTWRLLTLTLRRLLKNIGIVAIKQRAGDKLENEAYMMAIIVKSQETLEILVRRALIESSEVSVSESCRRSPVLLLVASLLVSLTFRYAHRSLILWPR